MRLKKFLIFILLSIFTISFYPMRIIANSFIPKKGGIAFRTDDNVSKEDFIKLDSLFSFYNNTYSRNYHFNLALNFAGSYYKNNTTVNFNDSDFIILVQNLILNGHEIMDHTPNHRTNYFITKFPESEYLNPTDTLSGVDHTINLGNGKTKVCLEFNPIDISGMDSIGLCNVSGDSLTAVVGDFNSFNFDTDVYVYLDSINQLFFIDSLKNNKTLVIVKDLWEDEVSLPNIDSVRFYKFDRANRLSSNAIKVLASETQKIADDYNIQRPTTWIQPGGRHPILSMAELSAALTPLGYTAGASFGEIQSLKVFNEYDTDDIKRFGMQWEDFNEDHIDQNFTKNKTIIADGIAKHKIMFGHNHFYTLGTTGYVSNSKYFEKVDSILSWCNNNNIDVRTYSQWADVLYNLTPNPYENIFPPLNINLDDSTNSLNPNGWPDGYYPRTNRGHGIWETDPGAPNEKNYCYTASGWFSRIFLVQNLGGIEKGEQEFEIWTKGGNHPNNFIKVIFKFPNTNYSSITFKFPANTNNWIKYNLKQSINENKYLNIPIDVSSVEIEILSNALHYKPVKVSGMYLAKKKPKIPVDLKIILEGSYASNGAMNTNPEFQDLIPEEQPFNVEPWNYNGYDEFENSPTGTVDWVLVELRKTTEANSMETRKAGLLLNDGKIVNADGSQFDIQVAEGDYYVVIHQRNHLSVMSSSTIPFHNIINN